MIPGYGASPGMAALFKWWNSTQHASVHGPLHGASPSPVTIPWCWEEKFHFTKLATEPHTYFIASNRYFPNINSMFQQKEPLAIAVAQSLNYKDLNLQGA